MNLIQKIINIFKSKSLDVDKDMAPFDRAVLAIDRLATSAIPNTQAVEGWLVFSCNCGQSQNVLVADLSIDDMKLWTCPKKNCHQKISIVEKRPK